MMHCPDTETLPTKKTDFQDLLYFGTDEGNVIVINVSEKTNKKLAALSWRKLFSHSMKLITSNPITAIKVHKKKPYKFAISFQNSGVIIWDSKVKFNSKL